MKAIAVSIPNGWAVRKHLLSDFLPVLAENTRVVLLSPLADDARFREHFERPNVLIERLNVPPLGAVSRQIERFLTYSHYSRIDSRLGSDDLDFQRTVHQRGSYRLRSRLRMRVMAPILEAAARRVGAALSIEQQAVLERLAYRDLRKESRRLAAVLRTYDPVLLFSTMPVIAYFDRPSIWAAEEIDLPVVCEVPGWDNLFSKGRMPIRFRHYLVWSDWMRTYLQAHYPDIGDQQVTATGAAFLDFCFRPDMRMSRGEFLRGLGGDPDKPLILWACAPKGQTPYQPQMVEQLWAAIEAGALPGAPQLLVRPHPVGGGAHFSELSARHPSLLFTETNPDDPGAGHRWSPNMSDMRTLINSVFHADVVVNFSSTITLEAFALDRPVVNVAYDFEPGSDYERFTRGAYHGESYKPIIDLAATRVAKDFDALLEHVRRYLGDPAAERDARRDALRLICGEMDGGSAARVAGTILQVAEEAVNNRLRSRNIAQY